MKILPLIFFWSIKMSYTLEQIGAATPENIQSILDASAGTSVNGGNGDLRGSDLDKRLKVARLYANPLFNYLTAKDIEIVNSPNFDLTLKTYGFNKGLTVLRRPTVTLKQVWNTPSDQVARFLKDQQLTVTNSDETNKSNLVRFYLKNNMFSTDDITAIKRSRIIGDIKTISLKEIWKLPSEKVIEYLQAFGIAVLPHSNSMDNKITLARLYAREGRLNDLDTELVNAFDFNQTFSKYSSFTIAYDYSVKKSRVTSILAKDISSIVEGYGGFDEQDYIFIARGSLILMLDSDSLEIIREILTPYKINKILYFNGLFYLNTVEGNLMYFSIYDRHINGQLDRGVTYMILDKTHEKIFALGNTKVLIFDISGDVPKHQVSHHDQTTMNGVVFNPLLLKEILVSEDFYYTIGVTEMTKYSLDGQELIQQNFRHISMNYGSIIVGNSLAIPSRNNIIELYSKDTLNFYRQVQIPSTSRFFTDGQRLYFVNSFSNSLMFYDPQTNQALGIKNLDPHQQLLDIHNGRAYFIVNTYQQILSEYDLNTGKERVVKSGISSDTESIVIGFS
jgi:hypothetical protein